MSKSTSVTFEDFKNACFLKITREMFETHYEVLTDFKEFNSSEDVSDFNLGFVKYYKKFIVKFFKTKGLEELYEVLSDENQPHGPIFGIETYEQFIEFLNDLVE